MIEYALNKREFNHFLFVLYYCINVRSPPPLNLKIKFSGGEMNRPKRRRSKDNPYYIIFNEKENLYYIAFYTSKAKKIEMCVDKKIYEEFDKREREDISIMNEYDRHIEHKICDENDMNRKILEKEIDLEEQIFTNLLKKKLIEEIKKLPDIQKRRIIMYFYKNMNLRDIAQIERCSYIAIKYSIDNGIKNLRKKLLEET